VNLSVFYIFGLAKVDTTVTRNINALRRYINRDDSLSVDEIAILNAQLDNLDFDVTLTGLSGLTEYADDVVDKLKNNVLNEAVENSNGLNSAGIKGDVLFFNTGVERLK